MLFRAESALFSNFLVMNSAETPENILTQSWSALNVSETSAWVGILIIKKIHSSEIFILRSFSNFNDIEAVFFEDTSKAHFSTDAWAK